MIQIATYTVDEIFNTAPTKKGTRRILPDGNKFKFSDRLEMFATKGRTCVTCGIVGTTFVLETPHLDVTPHINLYAIGDDGAFVLMTKDHIHPKSKGGPNLLSNYAPMCSPCNERKGNKT